MELLSAEDTNPVFLERIQDIDTNSYVIQVKYKETQDYTPFKIKEPVIQLLNEYQKYPQKIYYLYCYFNDQGEESRKLNEAGLDKILGNKKEDFQSSLKKAFVNNFLLVFSKSFQEQFDQVIKVIKDVFHCSSFEEALIYYSSITNHLRKLVTNYTEPNLRKCTKSEIEELILSNRKIVFDSAYRFYMGRQNYFAMIRKRHFSFRNIDNWERFFLIDLTGKESVSALKSVIISIKEKFYIQLKRDIKSGAPYIYLINISDQHLKQLKAELINEGYTFRDGYDFKDSAFRLKSMIVKSTLENEISLKFINNEKELLDLLDYRFDCTKIIYQFFFSFPMDYQFDIETVSINIKDITEIPQIL